MLFDRFLEWAKQSPTATAVITDSETVSYGDLLLYAQRIASQLRSGGVGPNERVAFQLDKTPQAIVILLGILLCGAAYVPIDPRAPAERVTRILRDAQPHAVVLLKAQATRLKEQVPNLLVDVPIRFVVEASLDDFQCLDFSLNQLSNAPATSVTQDSAAYILYTSGSTGTPKGVEISHAAAESFVHWAIECFNVTHLDVLTSFAPLSFDLSIFDVFVALSTGARVTLVRPPQLLKPRELVSRLREARITILYAVPTTIDLLVRDGGANQLDLPTLHQILYAGEPFPVPKLVEAMSAFSNARFYNLFGPTETNVCTYYALTQPPPINSADVPIGRTCEHLKIELCDDSGMSVPSGEPGEICVSGPAIMTGYFHDPNANQRVFFFRDLPDGTRATFYRTGDFAQLDGCGNFRFLGRRDRMVKRRGYRIELGEIESTLLRYPGIREVAAFTTRENDETHVHALVVPEPGIAISTLSLRAHCGTTLAPYLVPDSVKIIDKLPRTLTGKLDYQRLGSQNQS
jgi:amino acid adenylation domain-containing protein